MKKAIFLVTVFLFMVVAEPAKALPLETFQAWLFSTPDNPLIAEVNQNPFGDPVAQITLSGQNDNGLAPQWYPVLDNREGVWHADLIQIDLTIFNSQVLNPYKEVWVEAGFRGEDFRGIMAVPEGQVIDLGSMVTQTSDGWLTLTAGWRLEPNPTVGEIIQLVFRSVDSFGADVDYVQVYTVCVPEPATVAILGLGCLVLLRRKP
jgi:hypothetical protein